MGVTPTRRAVPLNVGARLGHCEVTAKNSEGTNRSGRQQSQMSGWTFRGNPVVLVRLAFIAGAGVVVAAASVLQDSALRRPDFAAHLEVEAVRTDTGEVIPVRVYLFKDEQPFRLSPVDSLLPLRVDLFYRERLWQKTERPKTLEVTVQDVSHVILLDGQETFDLPAGTEYRLEASKDADAGCRFTANTAPSSWTATATGVRQRQSAAAPRHLARRRLGA